jgi:predicted glycogen debranching enzyme
MAFPTGFESMQSEWIEPDGLGGFANGTISGIRTRRYHALLLAATTPPAGRMVLVNGFDAEISTATTRHALTTQHYAPGIDSPIGLATLESFFFAPWPTWTYAFPGGEKLIYETFVPRGNAVVVLRWRWEGPTVPSLRLHVRPFFSGRDFHALHHENPAFQFTPQSVPHGQRWHFYENVPAVTALTNGVYHHEPSWYRNFLYEEEVERGMDAEEDLAAPGLYEFDLAAGPAVLIFSADGLGRPLPDSTPLELAETLTRAEQTRRAAFDTPRLRAADAYLVARGAGQTIIAGYPWFGDWGRDTFISLRGLCLATGRLAEARDILTAWAGTVSQGMLPNRFPDTGDVPEYNSVDASLWYIIVVHEFLAAAGDDPALIKDREKLLATVEAILTGYHDGTRFGIRADADGLLACGVPGMQLTWMDAKVDDWVVTPRIGKPVEVQALWLNALHLAGRSGSPKWLPLFEKGLASFRKRFWNEPRGCLYDVVDVDHQPGQLDDRLRPNQLFAAGGLPLSLIEDEQAARVVQVAVENLWTPMGPRSLAPGEKDYAPRYEGTRLARDGAYHQGTVWPWLTGPFVQAWVRAKGGTPQAKARARELFLAPQLLRLDLIGLNHIPEIADAELPHTARGCPFQAWSLAEILRLEHQVLKV